MGKHYRYYLDWRPVGASPVLDDGAHLRLREVDKGKVASHWSVERFENKTGKDPIDPTLMGAFAQAHVIARLDGLFVLRLEFDGIDPYQNQSLDELAGAVSRVAKENLGHVHDAHQRAGKRRHKRLEASQVLLTRAIPLREEDGVKFFQNNHFTAEDLKNAEIASHNVPENETPRLALVCLRREFLRVVERILGNLQEDRKAQTKWRDDWKTRTAIVTINAVFVLAGIAMLFILQEKPVPSVRYAFAVVPTFISTSALTLFERQIRKWDRPRIRFLRASIIFFQNANPLNRVIATVLGKPEHANNDFTDIIESLKAKADGEQHRTGVHQFWMSISVAIASAAIAILALRYEDPPPPPIYIHWASILNAASSAG